MDGELFGIFVSYLPESWTGGLGLAVVVSAVVCVVWPKPDDSAHPFWKGLYRLVNALALNVGYAKNVPVDKKAKTQGALKAAAKAGIRGVISRLGARNGKQDG